MPRRRSLAYPEFITEHHAAANRAGENQISLAGQRRRRRYVKPATHKFVLVVGDPKFYFRHTAERIRGHASEGGRINESRGLDGNILQTCIIGAAMSDAADAEDLAARKISSCVRPGGDSYA